jgi:hypothetical protein
MLPPIPERILRSTALVKVCTAVDAYQNQTYGMQYTIHHVHLQPEEHITKTVGDTQIQLTGILFVDLRHSSPAIDWRALLQQAHDAGGDMRVVIRNVEYTVASADGLRDDTDCLHHWEIGVY